MYYCQYCNYKSNDSSNMRRHVRGLHSKDLYKCEICSAELKWDASFKRHMQNSHSQMRNESRKNQFGKQRVVKGIIKSHLYKNKLFENKQFRKGNVMQDAFDIRLKENFKLFISGPSRCGKTVFVSKLLENIHTFAKLPPSNVIYVYKVWQPKYNEMMSLGVNFMEDNNNIVDDIKSTVSGQSILVIFDDLISSPSLKNIANLFTVDARHMNMSMVFLTLAHLYIFMKFMVRSIRITNTVYQDV